MPVSYPVLNIPGLNEPPTPVIYKILFCPAIIPFVSFDERLTNSYKRSAAI
jgi:hypothetical protein